MKKQLNQTQFTPTTKGSTDLAAISKLRWKDQDKNATERDKKYDDGKSRFLRV